VWHPIFKVTSLTEDIQAAKEKCCILNRTNIHISRSYTRIKGDDFVVATTFRQTSHVGKRVTGELPLRLQSKINYVEYQREVRLVRSRRTTGNKGKPLRLRRYASNSSYFETRLCEPRRKERRSEAIKGKATREHRICVTIHYGSRSERKSRILKFARDKGLLWRISQLPKWNV